MVNPDLCLKIKPVFMLKYFSKKLKIKNRFVIIAMKVILKSRCFLKEDEDYNTTVTIYPNDSRVSDGTMENTRLYLSTINLNKAE
jgi:hypothetical protein